ncbi:hypothetical protein [Luteolibacter luteus]|uniref:F5/8 type C domain-containing protein n=1 Tax=Luteolibacter luteus TaxID=2728835 RepID=A0A858RLF9_9BACT|nr:hypothetical protein [Luteolibacter luteus]QJE97334.1 hypothetical protein HHL09_16575 [Luteolibacter luteus]
MKASRIAIFAVMLLGIVFLAIENLRLKAKVAGLESGKSQVLQDALPVRQKTQPPPLSPSGSEAAQAKQGPLSSKPSLPNGKVEQRMEKDRRVVEDEEARLESMRQSQVAETSALSLALKSAQREKIEHWTGGDKRSWGHEQAAGSPDTDAAGDIPSAWASKAPDGGEEWIKLDYDRFVELDKVSVVESHNPGAISKVVAVLSDGNEAVIWEGQMDASEQNELVVSDFPVVKDLRARSVKVYLDTTRVPGWNEIDAVQLVGKDGSKQWASASSSSSSYADP